MAIINNFPGSNGGRVAINLTSGTQQITVFPGTKYKLGSEAEVTATAMQTITLTAPVTGYIQYASATIGG